jgi:predicted ATP-grasp superfamily ATP-dependent carboligase
MFRVLITDACYKNAIALARHLRRDIPDLYLVGHSVRRGHLAAWYRCFDRVLENIPLDRALENQPFDLAIPVGGASVLSVAARCPDRAVLPSPDMLETCYDKSRTVVLAESAGVPTPKTSTVRRVEELAELSISYPCVVKPAREASGLKSVAYCNSLAELTTAAADQFRCLDGRSAVLVQEFIEGQGCGLFALMNHGVPLRVFMHQRLREFPPSGGPSTAARSFYSDRLKTLGLRLLSALHWHGVAMVEFRYSPAQHDFVLIEVNGKFWGSLELALSAGINFGADLVRLFRGERLLYSEAYDRDLEFYWPLDDDLLTLWCTRSLRRISDYWRPNAQTNLFQSLRADSLKSLRLAGKLATRLLGGRSVFRDAVAAGRRG